MELGLQRAHTNMALLPALTLRASNEGRSFQGILLLRCRKRWTNLVWPRRAAKRHAAALFRAPAGCCESERALAWRPQEQFDSEDGLFSASQIHMRIWLPVAGIIMIVSVSSRAGSGIEATSRRTAQLVCVQTSSGRNLPFFPSAMFFCII